MMTRKPLIGALFALAAALAVPMSQAAEESSLDFTLVNSTGYGIKEVYVSPTASSKWEENLIDEVLENNESLDISFDPKAKASKWDIMIVFVDDDQKVYWKGCKLEEISKITLKYNRQTGATTALTE